MYIVAKVGRVSRVAKVIPFPAPARKQTHRNYIPQWVVWTVIGAIAAIVGEVLSGTA